LKVRLGWRRADLEEGIAEATEHLRESLNPEVFEARSPKVFGLKLPIDPSYYGPNQDGAS